MKVWPSAWPSAWLWLTGCHPPCCEQYIKLDADDLKAADKEEKRQLLLRDSLYKRDRLTRMKFREIDVLKLIQ